MTRPIEDYAMIGDCQTAALIGRDGSVDWLCFPRFDSGACFAALLGSEKHGRWLLAPRGDVRRVRRRYREGTLVLETDFQTDVGEITIIDFMPPRGRAPDLVRRVVGRRGRVPMMMELIIRFDYGAVVPWVRRKDHALLAVAGPDSLLLRGDVPTHGHDYTTVAEFDVAAGETRDFVLTWFPSHEPPPPSLDVDADLEDTIRWWRSWSSRCTYDGPWRDAVVQSLVTLKALTYAPTGGIVAAPTTSLPEQPGGERNWDYRYCWLRDATFTLFAFINNGYTDEACHWRDWLLRSVAGDPSKLNIMYGLAGERRLPELELDWLPGYEGSRPVRIGNAACSQFQLDVYGEVTDLLHQARRAGLPPDENAWRMQRAMLQFLAHAWREPDEGIWEVRGPRRHFTHSKMMAWVAFDRAVKDVEQFKLAGDVERWRICRDEIHAEICDKGFNEKLGSFVQYFGGESLDASLLMMPLVGFLPPEDPRVSGTVDAIQKHLSTDGFVLRYPTMPHVDGLPPGEGAFLICSFWLADNLLLQKRETQARELFEKLLSLRNDVGLLSEEYEPVAGRMLGNFPQAYSHVGIINTASNLSRRLGPASERK